MATAKKTRAATAAKASASTSKKASAATARKRPAKPKTISAATKERSRKANPDAHLAAEVIKVHAAKQKIAIRLTPEQVEAIRQQWDDRDPLMPAEITFYAGRRAEIGLKVAGYRYRGDTCCV